MDGGAFVNVASELRAVARERPFERAVTYPAGRDEVGRVAYSHLTFEQLDSESDRIANALEGIGVRRGMRTVLMVRPGPEFVAIAFALFKLGAVLVLVDPGIGPSRLGVCLREVEPEAFIGIPRAQLARALLGWARGSIRIRVTVGGRGISWCHRLSALLTAEPEPPEPRAVADTASDETAAILFTSGSTGVPKGVVYTHGVFSAQIRFLRDQLDLRAGELDLATFPPFALFDPALGMTAVVPDMDASRPARADPAKLIEAIRDHGVVQMFASPALLDRLGRFGAEHAIRLPSLRRVVSAGAPVRPDILERMTGLLEPEARIFTPYGATEALPVTWIDAREILEETRKETARGGGTCVGRPVEGVAVRIIGITDEAIPFWSDDIELPRGEVGEIVVEGPIVTPEYFGRADSTRLAKIRSPDGLRVLHRMGDCGRIDEKGRLWFHGRKSHRVETPQATLFPIPCEGVANEHPNVFRSALVGVGPPEARRGILCLELEPGSDRSQEPRIRGEVQALLARYSESSRIESVLFHHGGFPTDRRHNAKIDRLALAAWATRQLA